MKNLTLLLSALSIASLTADEELHVCGPECVPEAVNYAPQDPEKKTQTIVVKGLTTKQDSKTIARTLNSMTGVTVEHICLKSGVATVNYNPATVKKNTITKAITSKNYTVGGERYVFRFDGIHCNECVKRVKKLLSELDGVTPRYVSENSTKVIVDIHSSKTDTQQVIDTLESHHYEFIPQELTKK
ncbi:heavy-metal-associated domain-containing protein [Rubritalea tangerina]|uniref:Cation transporter n=1 Tax=Rubritalea tangerina TaxID=430798 RepID=A0ABW4ZE96_9BACT